MVVRSHDTEPLPLTILRPTQTFGRQGEPAPGVAFVESGVLRVSTLAADGHELLLDVVGPAQTVGELGGLATCTVRALSPVRLRSLSGVAAARALDERGRRAVALAADLAWLDVTTRIERRLRDLASRIGRPAAGGVAIPIRLTQDDLAAMVGATRETANRAVRALVARRAIEVVSRGRYIVHTPLQLVGPGLQRDGTRWPSPRGPSTARGTSTP
jgi:CRP/FNR family transcriptional regulator, cyclic AMP receptor protein